MNTIKKPNAPNLLIINSAEPGIIEFIEPLQKIALNAKVSYKTIEYEETLTTDLSIYDGFLISGSPRGNDIVDHHLPYFLWIKECRVPVFGICAGHHVIGKMFGSKLLRSIEKEVGNFNVYIDKKDAIFNTLPSQFLANQNHHDSITLPQDFILLAHTEDCKNTMMKHKENPIYSTQFHPEILNKEILVNFIGLLHTFAK
jgi:GMP synthase (glutamine-hydrolysing)